MEATNLIPPGERYPNLRDFLFRCARQVQAVKSKQPVLIREQASPFLYLCYPWIAEPANIEQRKLLETRRSQFEVAGFVGASAKSELEEILKQDKHLRECCVSPGQLAQFLDSSFVTPATMLLMANAQMERLNNLFEEFILVTYGQGRFKAVSLSHVFNFDADESNLRFGDVRIERLDEPTISRVLGEQSFASFIHPPKCGEFFVVTEREGACDDFISWLFEERNKANLFVQVLQYFKDGIVHVDYAAPHFLPQWVNQLRKWGIFFVGNPHRCPYEAGTKPYRVTPEEIADISRWWTAYQSPGVVGRLGDQRNTLRQAGLRAGDYYEYNHTEEKPVGRLISLAIALEALFSPDDKGELNFRIAQYVGQLVGETPEQRVQIFNEMKRNFYGRRSKLVHGQYDVKDYYAGRFVTNEECDRWASIVRRAILRFLALYLQGANDRRMVLRQLSLAALDEQLANKIRTDSNIDAFLNNLKLE